MLLTAQELLQAPGVPSREKIREHLSGNYCRCTGYQAIVDAIEAVAQARAEKTADTLRNGGFAGRSFGVNHLRTPS